MDPVSPEILKMDFPAIFQLSIQKIMDKNAENIKYNLFLKRWKGIAPSKSASVICICSTLDAYFSSLQKREKNTNRQIQYKIEEGK